MLEIIRQIAQRNTCSYYYSLFFAFKAMFSAENPFHTCTRDYGASCRLGDLSNRIGTITIAGSKKSRSITRQIFIDGSIPLSGYSSIIGKSLVIYDDFGPKARGERLACAT